MAHHKIHIKLSSANRLYILAGMITIICNTGFASTNIEFNTDILDINDRANIDLSRFSKTGYFMPGEYTFSVHVNKNILSEQSIFYYNSDEDIDDSKVCLDPSLVDKFGLKPKILSSLTWWHNDSCLDLNSLSGATTKADLSTSTLYINIPQAYLEYTADNWDPPTRWEDGISGALFDYNLNAQANQQIRSHQSTSYTTNGNGVAGINLGPWRFRADWQTRFEKRPSSESTHSFDWNRFYIFRDIKSLGAKLTFGESYLNSDIFDSFRFTGLSLVTDINMLPPNLRGYAPEVTGVANSNATVIISQQGRTIYQTQVAAGPFRIQDLNDALSGELDVRVEEQNGKTQTFTVNTSSIPYLTRPGQVRYKIAAGRPSDSNHRINGDNFASGEYSWGINNGWSLYGGTIASQKYISATLGIGRDLMQFGALSFDATRTHAKIKEITSNNETSYNGNSYRLSYSKRFEYFNSQVTFAGYRFSEKDFMSMSEYLNAKMSGVRQYNSKEMYTISYNQQFSDSGLSTYLNFYHQTYWNQPDNNRYSLSLAKYFDLGKFKNLSVNLTAFRTSYQNTNDDGVYIALSVPWGETSTVSFNSSWDKSNTTQNINYYDRINERSNYQINTGVARSGAIIGWYYTYQGDMAQVNANATYQQNRYRSAGLSIQGGLTATQHGVALHRSNQLGASRVFVDTSGVPNIPLRGNGIVTRSNYFGKAVIADVNSYYRSNINVDLNLLPNKAEITHSVKQGTLTEGAIGYRQFDVITGNSAMATIRLSDNSAPPFGAIVLNARKQQVGIISDEGSVYLSGLNPKEKLNISWDNEIQCNITLPDSVSSEINLANTLLLPCIK